MRKIKFREWTGVEMDYEPQISLISTASINEFFDRETIMQFTGFIDKKGVEVYAGDYLVDRYPVDEEDLSKGYHESLFPVVFSDGSWCVDTSFKKDGSWLVPISEYFGEHLEVKGNIYKN